MSKQFKITVAVLAFFDQQKAQLAAIRITEQLILLTKRNIDQFHKWRPINYSFVYMLIRPTGLVLKEHFFCILSVLKRLVGLISTKTIGYFFQPPLMQSVY